MVDSTDSSTHQSCFQQSVPDTYTLPRSGYWINTLSVAVPRVSTPRFAVEVARRDWDECLVSSCSSGTCGAEYS